MDLLACLTAPPDSTMSIYRLLSEDQSPKLLSEKITGVGTSLAWSPCGRRLAVGDRLGGVTIYDGETGAVLHSRRAHGKPVTALSWADAGPTGGDEPSASRMLPPLLTVPSAPSNMYTETTAGAEEKVAGNFSLLVSADEGGHVVISAGGSFPLQAQDLYGESGPSQLSQLGAEGRRPLALRLSPDLRCLALLLGPTGTSSSSRSPAFNAGYSARSPRSPATPPSRPAPAQEGTPTPAGASAAAGELAVVVLDVRKLAVRRRELAQGSAMAEQLAAVALYSQQAVETLSNVWRGAASGYVKKIRALAECIQALPGHLRDQVTPQGTNASTHAELLLTLCTGNPSDAVNTFLTRQTSPQQLVRLERSLVQALDYVNLVACTRLQVAAQHLLTIIHELQACASWGRRFRSIGLEEALLQRLAAQTASFAKLTELLLLDCSRARRFTRTLFQLLLCQAQKLSEGAGEGGSTPSSRGLEPNASAPSQADVDDFVAAARQKQSLELDDVTKRIGAKVEEPNGTHSGADEEFSLATVLQELVTEAEQLAQSIASAMASQSEVLACQPVWAPSPWTSVASPELRAVASADATSAVPSPRSQGRSMIHMVWESQPAAEPQKHLQQLGQVLPAKLEAVPPSSLLLLWCGSDSTQSDLHLGRIQIPVVCPGVRPQLCMERARLKASNCSASTGHFLLCQKYDTEHVAALVLQETSQRSVGKAQGSALTTVCLVDITDLEFHPASGGFGKTSCVLPPAVAVFSELPEGAVRQSKALPESYLWASAMRVMSQRGVCSIYAWRARRLVTLDMDGDENDIDDDAG
eukprot:TRINITY_DN41302_c0_g1_i1.p1 TRINITY_DN41302_c0_g1~~TRINITY_DN41302_c0_g1_i1.p1  ORF type:complete len:877 (-),score=177.17 TRINITY_DN41302_c0_g1_i1:56-2488(-)